MSAMQPDIIRLAREAGFCKRADAYLGFDAELERFANLVIADFLERTGQYVTNDESREAAIAEAVATDRQKARMYVVDGAIAAAVLAEREACAQVCMDMQAGWCSDDHIACADAIRARA